MTTSTKSLAAFRSNATITGAGPGAPAIVFLHGLGANQSTWRHLVPAFEDRYQVVCLDLVGAGKSNPAAYDRVRHGSLHGHADDLLDLLQELNLGPVVFVGHSVSAIIGVLAAIKAPQCFSRLVLLAPSPRFVNDSDGYVGGFAQRDIDELLAAMDGNYHGWAESMAPVMLGREQPELLTELTNSFFQTNPELARHFARVTFLCDHRLDLPFLTTPSLILQCAHDVIAPLAVGSYLHEQLANSQLKVIDTPGHCAYLTAPSETLAAIFDFLAANEVVPA